MKRISTVVVWVSLLVVVLVSGTAIAGPTGSFLVYSSEALEVDANLDDWNLAAYPQPTFLLDPEVSFVRGPGFKAEDHQARVYLAYDEKYLYVGADVVDKTIRGSGTGNSIWNNTGIELWLNGGDINTPTAVSGGGAYESSDFQLNLAVMAGGKDTPAVWCFNHGVDDRVSVQLAVKRTSDGYTLEAAIPKADFTGLDALTAGGEYAMAVSTVSYAGGGWTGLFSPGPQWEYATLVIK